jgi:hypothetical protein
LERPARPDRRGARPTRRLDARLLGWFIRVLDTRPVTLRIDLDHEVNEVADM